MGREEKQMPLQKESNRSAVVPFEETRILPPQTLWKPIGGRLFVPDSCEPQQLEAG